MLVTTESIETGTAVEAGAAAPREHRRDRRNRPPGRRRRPRARGARRCARTRARGSAELAVEDGPRTVGRFVADALRVAGAPHAFTVPGESSWVCSTHPRSAPSRRRRPATRASWFTVEAHGQSRYRRYPQSLSGRGPSGLLNLAIGTDMAGQASSPMFAIVGQVERPVRGSRRSRRSTRRRRSASLLTLVPQPATAEDVPAAVAEAIRPATGTAGLVPPSSAEDLLLDEPIADDARLEGLRPSTPRATDDEIHDVIELLASARRPVILAGAGVCGRAQQY